MKQRPNIKDLKVILCLLPSFMFIVKIILMVEMYELKSNFFPRKYYYANVM